MTLDTRKHIESLLETSLALEDHIRASGGYSRDCAHIHDAIARGKKSGVALLWDSDGKLEVVDLNGGMEHVHVSNEGEHVTIAHGFEGWKNAGPRSEKERDKTTRMIEETSEGAYGQVNTESFAAMAAKSHEPGAKVAGKVPPIVHSGPKPATADKARLAAQLKAKQARNSADARAFTQAQMDRNARVFAAMKERSNAIHK